MTAQAKRHVFTLRTIGGGAVVRSLRYSAEPTRIVGAANPVTTEINLARADSFTQWHYKAAHRLRRLIAAHPENAEASECLGQVAMRDGDYGEAVRAFRHAAALQPDNFGIHVQLADVYLRQGRCDEAAVALRGALKLSPAAGDVRQRLESALAEQTMPAGDYVAPGLVRVRAERHFPNMVIGDCRDNLWPYLRRDSPHNWYVDRRVRNIGFVSRDEAHILFNTALQFEGMTALEIGCFMGFSTCHLALGGVRIDVVDPLLRDSRVMESVTSSLSSAGVIDACWFVPSPSPAAVEHLGEHEGRRWSLAFIDGDHEGDAPRHDAEVCERFLKPDALVLFHDLLSPDVAAGLHFFRGRGWKTRIYLTSQIMGVAWRGTVTPIEHIPDVAMSRDLPPHLAEWAADAS